MVTDSGTPLGTDGLRPLGLPQPADVEVDTFGLPSAVLRGRRLYPVAHVEEVWRVADGWWRDEPLARTYVRVLLEDGVVVTLYHDDFCAPGSGWHEQRY